MPETFQSALEMRNLSIRVFSSIIHFTFLVVWDARCGPEFWLASNCKRQSFGIRFMVESECVC